MAGYPVKLLHSEMAPLLAALSVGLPVSWEVKYSLASEALGPPAWLALTLVGQLEQRLGEPQGCFGRMRRMCGELFDTTTHCLVRRLTLPVGCNQVFRVNVACL